MLGISRVPVVGVGTSRRIRVLYGPSKSDPSRYNHDRATVRRAEWGNHQGQYDGVDGKFVTLRSSENFRSGQALCLTSGRALCVYCVVGWTRPGGPGTARSIFWSSPGVRWPLCPVNRCCLVLFPKEGSTSLRRSSLSFSWTEGVVEETRGKTATTSPSVDMCNGVAAVRVCCRYLKTGPLATPDTIISQVSI